MKIKNIIGVAGVILIIATCLAIISPTASKMITTEQDADEIVEYLNKNNAANPEEKEYLINQMQKYNEEIANGKRYKNETELDQNYYSITGRSDAIGFVKIPKINVELPIHPGIDDETLYRYAGHMPNTSFPIAGENIHAVISAHTAYPGRTFFDHLPDLELGDEFSVTVLDEKRTYKIINKVTVKPQDMSELSIQKGKNLVSLVTCFPYAVNTHRLIVTGELIKTEDNITTENTSSTRFISQPIDYIKEYPMVFIAIGISLTGIITATVIMIIQHKKLKKKLKQ